MVLQKLDRFLNRSVHVVKSAQPLFKVNATVMDHVDGLLGNTPLLHTLDHRPAVHMLNAAVRMSDHQDRFHSQFIDRDEKTSHHTAKGIGNNAARVFYQLHIAVFQPQSRGKQLGQPGIQTGQNGPLFIRILAGDIGLILFIF